MISLDTLARGLALWLHLWLHTLPQVASLIRMTVHIAARQDLLTRIARSSLLGNALMLGTGLPPVDSQALVAASALRLPVLLLVLAVGCLLLLFNALLLLLASHRHRVVVLVVRRIDTLPIFWGLGREAQLLVELLSELLQFGESLA